MTDKILGWKIEVMNSATQQIMFSTLSWSDPTAVIDKLLTGELNHLYFGPLLSKDPNQKTVLVPRDALLNGSVFLILSRVLDTPSPDADIEPMVEWE